MNQLFFYGSIGVLLVIFLAALGKKQFSMRHFILMMGYSLYNLIFELIFGEILDLYYYIDKEVSLIYIILAAIFLYPLIAVLYILFLPAGKKKLWYTTCFITGVFILELISLRTGTILLTGWKVIPWSIVTYIVSLGLINCFNRFLLRKLADS